MTGLYPANDNRCELVYQLQDGGTFLRPDDNDIFHMHLWSIIDADIGTHTV